MLGNTWYSIDVSGNDSHIVLFYKKCHLCHLLPFAKVGQYVRAYPITWTHAPLLAGKTNRNWNTSFKYNRELAIGFAKGKKLNKKTFPGGGGGGFFGIFVRRTLKM